MKVQEIEINSKEPICCVCYKEKGVTKSLSFFENEKEAIDLYWKYREEITLLGDALEAVDKSFFWNEKNYSEDNEDAYRCYTGRTWLAKKSGDYNTYDYDVEVLKEVHMWCCNEDDLKK